MGKASLIVAGNARKGKSDVDLFLIGLFAKAVVRQWSDRFFVGGSLTSIEGIEDLTDLGGDPVVVNIASDRNNGVCTAVAVLEKSQDIVTLE